MAPTEKPKTRRRDGYEQSRIVQKTGRVNDAHGIFLERERENSGRGPLLCPIWSPSYTQIIQQLPLIMPLSRNYVLAAAAARENEPAALIGVRRRELELVAAFPGRLPARHLGQRPHLKFIRRRLRFLCRRGSGSRTTHIS